MFDARKGLGQPGPLTDMNCVTIDGSTGLWYSSDCDVARKYVCQFPSVVMKQLMEPTPEGATTCEDGWTFLETAKKCIKAINYIPYQNEDDKRQWSDALQQCRRWGGDLLSIHSQAETDEING